MSTYDITMRDQTVEVVDADAYEQEGPMTTFFEIAGCHARYHCPQSRTLFFGEPPNKYRKAEEALMAATAAVSRTPSGIGVSTSKVWPT